MEYAIQYVVEYNPGFAAWEETMRTQDEEKARLHFAERKKHYPNARWRLSKVQILESTQQLQRQ